MKQCVVFLIRFYQIINPFKGICRFQPTCSEYAIQAISRYGTIKGIWLGAKRIARCYPGSKGGLDSVK